LKIWDSKGDFYDENDGTNYNVKNATFSLHTAFKDIKNNKNENKILKNRQSIEIRTIAFFN
jgi:hypothetical protein